jgi:hypothetical protein
MELLSLVRDTEVELGSYFIFEFLLITSRSANKDALGLVWDDDNISNLGHLPFLNRNIGIIWHLADALERIHMYTRCRTSLYFYSHLQHQPTSSLLPYQ